MKTQKNAIVVFLLIISVIFTYLTPLVFAVGEPGTPGNSGLGASLGNQLQGSSNDTSQMGGPGGNQTGGNKQNNSGQQSANNTNQMGGSGGNQTGRQSQSSPGEPGYGNGNNTPGDQHQYQYQKQNMDIDGEGNCTRIRSQYRNNNTEETFEIFFNIDNAPTIQLSYIPNLNATTNQHHFSLIVEQLIEYNDMNANGKYDHNDVIVSTLLMSNITFTNITYTNDTTPDGKTITIIETHTPDNVFSIVIYFTSERTSFFNNIITPKEVKIDFNIVGYPFVNQTSQLALITHVETPFAITPEQNTYDEQQGIATQESGLNISSGSHCGFFSWANDAIVDNTSYPVNVTVVSETEQTFTGNNQETYTQTQVIFSYPRGESIIHDPKIGVIDILQNILPSALQLEYLSIMYLLTCIISGIVFYGVIRYRKRQ
jgi:hypothetical protein